MIETSPEKNIRFFDIAWDSDKDGAGTRVVVYLQGCQLRCPWCHSPHSIAKQAPVLLYPDLCRHCGCCAEVCPTQAHLVTASTHTLDQENVINVVCVLRFVQ